jgi:ParB family transcriptional regulator, chromosome partitioning protein
VSRKRLGRGLDALLSGSGEAAASGSATADVAGAGVPTGEIAIDDVVRGRYQPRREFAQESLEELAASIRTQGLMQPIVVRPRPQGGYELIAGERRWRAARLAGLQRIAAVIRSVSDEQASAMALIENIQREDLNPLEEAAALARLRDEFELTQQQVANAVGKSREAVANLLRLLNLSPPVRDALQSGAIEMGHARALVTLDPLDQERLAQQIASRGLSVRQTEALVRQHQQRGRGGDGRGGGARSGSAATTDVDIARLERELSERIGAPVAIHQTRAGRGQLVIGFTSLDELDGILSHLR